MECLSRPAFHRRSATRRTFVRVHQIKPKALPLLEAHPSTGGFGEYGRIADINVATHETAQFSIIADKIPAAAKLVQLITVYLDTVATSESLAITWTCVYEEMRVSRRARASDLRTWRRGGWLRVPVPGG